MKRILLTAISMVLAFALSAQVPQAFKYQTVVRDNTGVILDNQDVYFRISVLQGSSAGTVVYCETFSLTTNDYGLASFNIGEGAVESGDFTAISWSSFNFWIKVELDPDGAGTGSYEDVGTSQLLSVPYAIDAKTAENAYWVKNVNDISYNSGNIGIGITNPTAKLDLRGTMYAAGTNPFGTFTFVETTDSHSDVHESILTVQNISGGISSQANIKFDAGPGGHGKAIISGAYDGSDENGKLTFKVRNGTTSYVNALTLRSSGNVGINETNPDSKLHVAGNAHVTGDLTVDGAVRVSVSPVADDDAVNKAYVDAIVQKLSEKGVIVVDADGNIYSTVRIGSQLWMAENLKTTKYSDGTPITYNEDTWAFLTTEAYCWYNNNEISNKDLYGALYNYYAVTNAHNLCPQGWHVPTDAEWTTLTTYLETFGFGYGGTGSDIAKSLASTSGWAIDGTGGNVGNDQGTNNTSGFTGLPGGHRAYDGPFYSLGSYGGWWSTSNWNRSISSNVSTPDRGDCTGKLSYGFSVRCLKN